jgi:hypothetical protein
MEPEEEEEDEEHEDMQVWAYCPRCNTFHGAGDHVVVHENFHTGEEALNPEVPEGIHGDVADDFHVLEDSHAVILEELPRDILRDIQQERETHEAAVRQIYEEIQQDLREESSRDLQERILENENLISNDGLATSAHTPGVESEDKRGIKRYPESIVRAGCCSRATGATVGLYKRARRFFGGKNKGTRVRTPTENDGQGVTPIAN